MGKVIFMSNRMGEKIMENREMIISINTVPAENIDTVSNYFLSKKSMSPKKLQKMCYYAYAWYLTMYNQLLFDDGKFQAWVHGPVNKKLYDKYKVYGWGEIPRKDVPKNINENTREFLNIIFDTFSRYSADDLELMTHQEEPWIRARNGINANLPSNEILDDNIIKRYYSSLRERAQLE